MNNGIVGLTPDRQWAVEGVAAPYMPLAWPFVWPLLEPSIAVIEADLRPSPGEIAADIATGLKQLWLAWDMRGDSCDGAVLTEIRDGDESLSGVRECLLYAAGGRGVRRWIGWMSRLLRPWAAAQGCRMIVHGGRPGWSRILGTEPIETDFHVGPLYGRPVLEH